MKNQVSAVAINDRGMVEFWNELPARVNTNVYALTSGQWQDLRVYDGNGNLHVVEAIEPDRPPGKLEQRLSTLYSRKVGARLKYSSPARYGIDELKKDLYKAIDLDDDILTQFVEAGELKSQIGKATTFPEIIAVLQQTGDG